MFSRLGIAFMRFLSPWPLAWVRALGWLMGLLLYGLAVPRRRVAMVNLALCFPQLSPTELRRLARGTFIHFAQAWLDRAWLWHGKPELVQRRVRLVGALHELQGDQALVLFAPHFVGLDAGWTALTQQVQRGFTTIFTQQPNADLDAWVYAGRKRFGQGQLFRREQGVKPIIAALREGHPLYLLPDMNFGPEESIFVPFYGVPAATVPSLSRFARLGRARVVPVLSRLTEQGYEVQVLPAWSDFPSDDIQADTARMNQTLQAYIDTMPDQYFWVHKRFKTRPEGSPEVY